MDEKLGKRSVEEGSTQPKQSESELMKAIVWKSAKQIACEMMPKPLLTHPKDVIVKVTACSICSGSDSHIYSGEIVTMDEGFILGHEACGIIESKGDQVEDLNIGDRVVVCFNVACGKCAHCKKGEWTGCDCTSDSELFSQVYGGPPAAAIFGYSRLLGNIPGSQAEYVRVPFGDVNCFKLPDDVTDEQGIYASDVLCTSLHATELGEVQNGDVVVIWGLGPIGLYTAAWSKLKGAARVVGIDIVPERLALAREKFGLETFDRSDLSRDQVIKKLQGMLPPRGADVVIKAAGFRFAETCLHKFERVVGIETDAPDILRECFTLVRKSGRVSIIADYVGIANQFPIGHIMMKYLTVRSGQCPCQKYMPRVIEALQKGEIDPSRMVTHHILLEEAPEAYKNLFEKKEGFIKVLITPAADKEHSIGTQQKAFSSKVTTNAP
jgi:threonine dehydrogenase-like Zn-dependent dehydrogenase